MNLRTSSRFRVLSEIAPAATIVLLLLLPMLLPNRAVISADLEARQAAIKATMDSLPYTVGTWVGSVSRTSTGIIRLFSSEA